jgi:small-conductance mechanosensitive channel
MKCALFWPVQESGSKLSDKANIIRILVIRRMNYSLAIVFILYASLLIQTRDATAQTPQADEDTLAIENSGVPVEIDGRPILVVYASIAGITPQERAQAIQQRIITLARRKDVPVTEIRIEDRGTWSEIVAAGERIMGVTKNDAQGAERDRVELAAEYAEVIRQAVQQYRSEHTWRNLLLGVGYTALATLGVGALLLILVKSRGVVRPKIERWTLRFETESSTKSARIRLRRYTRNLLTVAGRVFFWIVVLALIQVYGTLVLRFFPATKYTSYQITNWLFSELAGVGKIVIEYVPHLILVLIICLVTSYLIRLNTYIFGEVRDEKLTIRGFYPEWAEPTAQLVKVFIVAAAAVMAFPYLPGSDSPAFKGISVFLGVLLSLGSTSAVAHGVAGTILTYMRAFKVGDFVKIGSDMGEVVEKTLLVTRIRTQKRELVTIPNGTVLGGVVINYSAEGRHEGVIFHTTVTIGYSAPWRQVHELLLSAALNTEDILRMPAPFVLQTGLSDFYVCYELNAYTAKPMNMQRIYSVLHQNIQDRFNEAGLEINSPHYLSLRDGNQTTIPEGYLAKDHKPVAFGFEKVEHRANSPKT